MPAVKGARKRRSIKKEFTKEDLKRMGLICNTDKRPKLGYTNEKWQTEFALRKKFITPYPRDMERLKCPKNDNSQNYRYTSFINNVLKNIKKGEVEYVFYIYQIEELAKFFPNELRTMYLEDSGCWSVWLGAT